MRRTEEQENTSDIEKEGWLNIWKSANIIHHID